LGFESLLGSRFDSLHSLTAIATRRIFLSEVEGMKYFIYILRTSSNTLYVGQTNNLKKRLFEHQRKMSKSSKYMKYFSSFELVYSESHVSRSEAMKREWQLKKWTKAKKEALIEGNLALLEKL